jgi:hypothetical protein
MKISLLALIAFISFNAVYSATGIFGGYLTLDGTKYKSSGIYGGAEPTFDGANLGTFSTSDDLILSQFETFTFQNSGHSTFEFALAHRVRLQTDAKSTNPADYTFEAMGDGFTYSGASLGDEKAELTGQTINIMDSLAPGNYSLDIVHKVGAWEGGSNFERLANINNANPGDTSWSNVNAFSADFVVVPEPSSFLMIGIASGAAASLALIKRRKRF